MYHSNILQKEKSPFTKEIVFVTKNWREYLNEISFQQVIIPGFEKKASKFSPRKPLRCLPETVRAIGLQPQAFRTPDGQVRVVEPYIPGATGKAQIFENWLDAPEGIKKDHPVRVSGEGHATEFVMQDILHVMAREYITIQESAYGVLPAPYALDPSDKENRGGDLLLVRYDDEGIPNVICLIDIKMSPQSHTKENGKTVNTTRRLKSGMNRRLSYPVPVIVVFVGDIPIEQQTGKIVSLRDYIAESAYHMAKEDAFTGFLPGIARGYEDAIFAHMRERIHKGCLATKEKIKETAKSRGELDAMLFQVALTDKILGSRQYP